MTGYGYVEDIPHLNKEEILTRVTQQEIFSMVMECQLGRYYISPFRTDENPGAYFDWYGHKLFFVDFGDTVRKHRDCFNAIQDIYGVSFNSALSIIDNHFNLGLGIGNVAVPDRVLLHPAPIKVLKDRTDIIYQRRRFTTADQQYWQSYGITSRQLTGDKVVAIVWYRFFSKRLRKEVAIRPSTIAYAYSFGEHVKVYTPHAQLRKRKWITNCTVNDIGFMDVLPLNGRKLTITKSYKDARILRNMGIETIWFQNEGMIPDDEILVRLCKRFDKIFVLFDNDSTGINASEKLVQVLNSHFPGKASSVSFDSGGKDTGEFYLNKGKPMLLQFLNKEGLM